MLESICRNVPVVGKKEQSGEAKATKTVMFKDIKDDEFMSIFLSSKTSGPNLNLA
jgi:hypothetical protein